MSHFVYVVPELVQDVFGKLAAGILAVGGTAVLASTALHSARVLQHVLAEGASVKEDSLGYGQSFGEAGLHLMSASTRHPVELLTGLAATGVDIIIALVSGNAPLPPHPLVPVIQVAAASEGCAQMSLDLDVVLQGDADAGASVLAARVVSCANREQLPKLFNSGLADFQLARAAMAVSL